MLVDLHELEHGALEAYAQRAVGSGADAADDDDDCVLAARDANPLTAHSRAPCGASEADFAQEYWRDPRIHSFGNMGVLGAVHAGVAPLFTRGIDLFAYDNIDLRGHVLAQLGASRAARLDNPVAAHTVRLAVDLGCGTGTMTRALAKGLPRARVRAFDTSDEMLGVANALTAEAMGAAPRVAYARGNAERTPLAPGSADVVAISFVLHEAPAHGRRAILAEARRLLAPGGTLVVVDIARAFEPSPMMLIGEPYVHGYQEHIDAEIRETFSSDEGFAVEFFEPVSDRAEMWFCHAPVAPTPEFELDAGAARGAVLPTSGRLTAAAEDREVSPA